MSNSTLILLLLFLMYVARPKKRAPQNGRPLTAAERSELTALLSQGKKVAAVRRHRELTGSGLLEAAKATQQLES